MSKVFTFLAGLFVCALLTSGALAASKPAANQADSNAIVAFKSSTVNLPALSVSETLKEIADAKTLLKSHSLPSDAPKLSVTLAALDPATSQINLVSVAKESFLKKDAEVAATTQLGNHVQLHILRPNGVNTAVKLVNSANGAEFLPLAVAYPIERNGAFTEMAYYTSGHPALLSPEMISAGEDYVARMLEAAASHLESNGVTIAADIVNISEHLCVVEHTDHRRFLNENRGQIYPEILSLYALNQGETFRYSISSAGAGGMIQMIPKTYAGIREHHPNVDLESDFVRGMSNHENALAAMLLYINDTWNYLQKSPEVQKALNNGIATKSELLAAGYNSNPMRLPKYLKDGGAGWRSLIPAETQMYLAIYSSVDQNTTLTAKPTGSVGVVDSSVETHNSEGGETGVNTSLVSWLRALLAETLHRL